MSIISPSYAVRMLVTESGERFPLLIETKTGLPDFDTTVFTVSIPRAKNRASATIEQSLRAIMVFMLFCERDSIHIKERMKEGRLFDLAEIDNLSAFCRLSLTEIHNQVKYNKEKKSDNIRILSSEKVRMGSQRNKTKINEIKQDGIGIRLIYIKEYISWLVAKKILKLKHDNAIRTALESSLATIVGIISAKIAEKKGQNDNSRLGLDKRALSHFNGIIDPAIIDKPWRTKHGRQRNTLMLQWFLRLGLRRGELAGIKIEDINFQENTVIIHRRADDPTDPRLYQPNAKTNARVLALDEDLAQITREYVSGTRRNNKGARKHGFLFVATGTGSPISLRSINSIFEKLRERWPDVFDDLSPHVLRHTFNDEYSRLCDESKISSEEEEKIRRELNGWSLRSKQAARYTQRHIRRKSRIASLDLQKKIAKSQDQK